MKTAKRLFAILLIVAMMFSLTLTASAEPGSDQTTGSITITNATIGEAYHVYKLFDVAYGAKSENGETPTTYIATESQKTALEKLNNEEGTKRNVFGFTPIPGMTGTDEDGNETKYYQVTVKESITDEAVIAFIKTFIHTLSGSVPDCTFPGVTEQVGSGNEGISENVATASTVTFKNLPAGYYFVTSSLGTVVTIDTANPNVLLNDKNSDNPDWNNEPEEPKPDGPVKDVQNDSGQSIDGDYVKVGDILTYVISYTNSSKDDEQASVLDSVTITDIAPDGTEYVANSAAGYTKCTDEDGAITEEQLGNDKIAIEDSGRISWTFEDVAIGSTVVVKFKVEVTEDALEIEERKIVNDADAKVKIGENEYDLTTNKVENPLYDPDDPVKDVKEVEEDGAIGTDSIDGADVHVGDILAYEITYTNKTKDEDDNGKEIKLDSVTITDAAPTGTVYVADSAVGSVEGDEENDTEITTAVAPDGTITWKFEKVDFGETVKAVFKVEVTEAALTITNKTIENDAETKVEIGDKTYDIMTNKVTNPVPENPGDPNPGKVIINADGSETKTSTGAFGDTVKFSIGVNAVNKVKDESDEVVQVTNYYIYDRLDKGFTLDEDSMVLMINGTEYGLTKGNGNGNSVTTWNATGEKGTAITFYTCKVNVGGADEYTLIMGTIPWVDQDKNALYPDCKINLNYEAAINEGAVIAGGGNPNKARFDYSTTSDTDPEEPDPKDPKYPKDDEVNHYTGEKTTITYTYALAIQKISDKTGEPLEGAEFTLVDAGGNTVKAVSTGAEGVYNYTSSSEADGAVERFVTNDKGQIIIKGIDIGTYSFTEAKAPEGYNLLTEPVSVDATMTSSTTTVETTKYTETRYFEAITEEEFESFSGNMYIKTTDDNNNTRFTLVAESDKPESYPEDTYYYKLVEESSDTTDSGKIETTHTFDVNATILLVTNSAGSELPSTGGMGTTVFYILGAVLVLGAGILLVVKRRMNADK